MNNITKQQLSFYRLEDNRPEIGKEVIIWNKGNNKMHVCKVTTQKEYMKYHSSDRGYPWAREDVLIFFDCLDEDIYFPEKHVDGWLYTEDIVVQVL